MKMSNRSKGKDALRAQDNMELIEIAKNVEATNSAIEKLGLNPDNERKPFAILVSVGWLNAPIHQLRKDNCAFFYDYHNLWNALVWTFGNLGRAIIENKDFELLDSDENISTFATEFEFENDRVIVYVHVRDMR